jgi:uncharacterized membrane protein YbhN (UPF0104 family)
MGAAVDRKRAILGWAARLTLSAIVLAVVFHFVPIQEVWQVARRLPPLVWISGLVVFLAGHALAAAKWRMLIGGGVSYPRALQAHLAGLAANLCLPSVAGGDVVRAGLVYRQSTDPARLTLGSLADRIIDTLGLVFLAAAGAWIAFSGAHVAGPAPQILAGLALAGVVGLLVGCLVAPRLAPLLPKGEGKLARLLAKAAAAAIELARRPDRLMLALALSMVVQGLFIGVNVAFADAVGLSVTAPQWVFAWSTAKIIAIAPISLGGLGVREGSTAVLLKPFGADAALVVAIGLVWQTLLYVSGLIGLLIQFPGRASAKVEVAGPQPSSERPS